MRLTLLERYIGSTMLKATGMALVVLVVLLVFFGLMDEAEDVGRGDYSLFDAFLVTVSSAPRYVFEVFPVAALIGSLLGLGAMGMHGELIAMRGAGFSLRQIVMAVLKTGVLMMLLVFLFGELVAPASEQWGVQYRAEKMQKQVTLKTRYGFWARDGAAFINIRDVLPGGRLQDIYIYEFDQARRLTLVTRAESAEHQRDHWQMHGISQSQISESGISERKLDQARWDSMLDPGLLSAVLVRPSMLPVYELYRYMRAMHANGQSATDFEVAFWVKLATPFATLVMLFISVPFVLAHQRFVSMGQRMFLGAILGMAFFTLSRGMSYVGVVYEISPILSGLVPMAAFLAIGLYMMRRVH
ncbi:MAG: LPS export ABC transporter permease LptG [Chromatiaceae bacterium]|nr:LPS export ABC transporter permease LptG [Chromatiaceae bacterium]